MSDLLYGVVEWLNNNPALDGMKYFTTKDKAIDYANIQEELSPGTGFNVKYTIIRLEKAI